MSAGYQELFLEQGASFSTTITVDDVYGDAYDLNEYSAACQMRKSYYSSNATATFTTEVYGGTGSIVLILDSTQTSNIAPGRYVYDILIYSNVNTSNNTIRILEGIINVTPCVTKI